VRPHPSAALAVVCLALAAPVSAQGVLSERVLSLGPSDLRIEQQDDGGYHLYLRAKPGLGSVLLTESTKDPARKTDSYAYRSETKNAVNGLEARILGGKSLPGSSELHFLVDSSPEPDAVFGSAFHIFIPWVVTWGYPGTRSGREFIHDGSFVNIRTFAKPYADYSGPWADNPYLIRVSQAPSSAAAPPARSRAASAAVAPRPEPVAPKPEAKPAGATAAVAPIRPASAPAIRRELYIPETLATFEAIARANRGELRYASAVDQIVPQISAILDAKAGSPLDLVLCLDTTDTMQKALDALKKGLPSLLSRRRADFPSLRLGLVAYKDYFEEYLYRRFDFVREVDAFAGELDSLQSGGGRDIPEAVYEALYEASTEFPWSARQRLVILVGDAPPHPLPRGSVDAASVNEAGAEAGVEIDALALPK
jgi:hypothetical protein